ncbi:MAG: DUF2244 domain-containing protein [Thiomonas sp.]
MDEAVLVAQARHWPQTGAPGSLLLRPVWHADAWHWHFRRNCALRPAQLFGAFAVFALASIVVAVLFWLRGVHLVAPFTGLELAAVCAALLVYARHAADQERIAIGAGAVVVEWERGGRQGRAVFDPRRIRIQALDGGLVQLSDRNQKVLIGRHLRPERRAALARDLRRAVMLT